MISMIKATCFLGLENAQLKRQIVRPVEDIVTCHTGTSFLP